MGQLSLRPGLQQLRLTFNRNLRKVEILLRECERTEKKVDYYALGPLPGGIAADILRDLTRELRACGIPWSPWNL